MARLVDAQDGAIVLTNLELAKTFWSRFKGLQFRKPLEPNSGLWLSPCSSIHTCFMRFPIDVMMIDRQGVVLKIERNVRPWRIVIAPAETNTVLETACQAVQAEVGHRLIVD